MLKFDPVQAENPDDQGHELEAVEPLLLRRRTADCEIDDDKKRLRKECSSCVGFVDRFFHISQRGSTIGTELAAGCACFLSASVALPVIPAVMSKSGIPVVDAVTSLCISASLSCFIVGLLGNLPFVLVPSLGMTIFFTYGMRGISSAPDPSGSPRGTMTSDGVSQARLGLAKPMDLETALACVLIAGAVVVLLTASQLIERGMQLVPNFLKTSTIVGIGMQVTFIGIESAGLVKNGQMADLFTQTAWPAWVSLCGLVAMAALLGARVRGSILMGMSTMSVIIFAVRGTWPSTVAQVIHIYARARGIDRTGRVEGLGEQAQSLSVSLACPARWALAVPSVLHARV